MTRWPRRMGGRVRWGVAGRGAIRSGRVGGVRGRGRNLFDAPPTRLNKNTKGRPSSPFYLFGGPAGRLKAIGEKTGTPSLWGFSGETGRGVWVRDLPEDCGDFRKVPEIPVSQKKFPGASRKFRTVTEIL